MTEPRESPDDRVKSTLKGMIEVNLARERALAERAPELRAAFHSNGVIFSRSGNGTPFSNGIIFSRTGSPQVGDVFDPVEGSRLVDDMAGLDEEAFSAFTERLLRLKQVKGGEQISEGP